MDEEKMEMMECTEPNVKSDGKRSALLSAIRGGIALKEKMSVIEECGDDMDGEEETPWDKLKGTMAQRRETVMEHRDSAGTSIAGSEWMD